MPPASTQGASAADSMAAVTPRQRRACPRRPGARSRSGSGGDPRAHDSRTGDTSCEARPPRARVRALEGRGDRRDHRPVPNRALTSPRPTRRPTARLRARARMSWTRASSIGSAERLGLSSRAMKTISSSSTKHTGTRRARPSGAIVPRVARRAAPRNARASSVMCRVSSPMGASMVGPMSQPTDPTPREAALARVIAVRGDSVEVREDRLSGEEPLAIRACGPGQEPSTSPSRCARPATRTSWRSGSCGPRG